MDLRAPQLDLEVLNRQPRGPAHKTPLLFIHGAFVGAWCWDEHFLPYFADAGYPSYALSLSGHGGSRGRERLDSFSIADYVNDVREVVERLPAPPVLIGHSMGGFIVQKYLEKFEVPAAVLLCSVPPQGLMAAAFGLLFARPGLLRDLNTLMGGGRASYETLREAMFGQEVDPDDLKRFYRLSQPESHRAIWDMTLFSLPSASHILRHLTLGGAQQREEPPLLVLGAERDHLTPASTAHMTARSYGVGAEVFPHMGHGLMLERDWRIVADRIRDWLKEHQL